MLKRIRRGLSFANVCSILALTIALGTGTAYAANTVFSEDIVNGEVKTADIATNAVRTAKIDADAVDGSKVLDGSLSAADLGADSVGPGQIQQGGVGSDEIASGAVGSDEIATGAVNAQEIADNAIDSGEVINDSLFASDLASGSVGGSEIASNAVTGGDVASNSLTLADLLGADASGHVSLSGVPNGRCSNITMNVSGAQVGQVALVSTKAAMQNGIVLYAQRVSQAGKVGAAICNFSGTSMVPIVDLPVRVITFG